MLTLGQRLRLLIKQKGFTLDRLSAESKINVKTLSEIQNDKVRPRVETLLKIAEALDVSMSTFFDESGPVSQTPLPVVNQNFYKLFRESTRERMMGNAKMIRIPRLLHIEHGDSKESFIPVFEETSLEFPRHIIPTDEHFAVNSPDEAMAPQIRSGDLLLVRLYNRTEGIRNGDLCLCLINGTSFSMREAFISDVDDSFVLFSYSPQHPSVHIKHTDHCRILGKAVWSLRNLACV